MNRFLATTAVALLGLGPAAYAQDTAAPAAPAAGDTGFVQAVSEGDVFASDLMGMDIYASADELGAATEPVTADARAGWEDIGEVGDLLVSEDGQIEAVLVDIGGFLGMGEHTVALGMDRIKLMTDETGARLAAITATKASLEAAPEFERPDAAPPAGGDTLGAAPGAVGLTPPAADSTAADTTAAEPAPADTMAADDSAMEPAAEGNMAAEPAPADTTAAGDSAMEPAAEGDMAAEPAPADTMAAGAFAPPEGYVPLAMEELTAERLDGASIYGQDDKAIGSIAELVLDPSGKVTQAVVDVGGFLGMGAHTVALDFAQLNVVNNPETGEVRVYSNASKEQLEQMPEYEG